VPPRTRRPFLQFFENRANTLNDSDDEWWPFLSLRCAPHERMTLFRTLVLATAYAAPAALFAVVLGTVLGDQLTPRDLVVFLPTSVVAVFLLLQLGVAYSWNRRAVRLRIPVRSETARARPRRRRR
jgi:hypothetical protein